jgi:hypothetical protein
MNTAFDRIDILKIQFEDNNTDVHVDCLICRGNVCNKSTLIINYSDLNRLLARLSLMQIEIDFSAFKVSKINRDENIYEFDAQNVLDFIPVVEQFELFGPYRQICA